MRTRTTVAVALAATALLAGCSTPDQTPPTASATSETTAPAPTTELPDTAAGAAAARLLELLAPEGANPTEDEVAELFSTGFLDVLPYDELVTTLEQLRAAGPYPVVEVTGGDDTQVSVRLGSEPPVLMQLSVDADGRILGFPLYADHTEAAEAATTLPELDAAMAGTGAQAQTYVGRVEDGACTTVHSTDGLPEGGEPAPSGSVFKLAVLSVVVDAIADGDLGWETGLTIDPELKSLPTGELQDRPDGDVVTVREAADLMISISDNTAADLLIDAVGQDRMVAAMPELGVTDPDRFDPFMTTRQLYLLGWLDDEARAAWGDATSQERHELVDQLPASLDDVDLQRVQAEPVWPDGVDWFLSGGEICSIYAELTEQAQTEAGAPVLDILSINPGLQAPEGVDYLGFKGGSVTGVIADAHLMVVGDTTLVYVSQAWGDATTVSTATMLPFFEQGLHLTAAQADG